MIDVVSILNMRQSDEKTASVIPSLELMRRAGNVLYSSIPWKGNIDILVGAGNNGGDGFALACFLAENGFSPIVYKIEDEVCDNAFYFEQKAKQLGVIISNYVSSIRQLEDADILVDCLFGTGLNRTPQGLYLDCIEEINSYPNKTIISCDINSGVNGDLGPTDIYVKSDYTVCIQAIKKGMLIRSKEYLKNVIVADIGIDLLKKEDFLSLDDSIHSNKDLEVGNDMFYYSDSGHKVYFVPDWLKVKEISYK